MEKLSFGIIALGANLPSTSSSASETLLAAASTLHDMDGFSITSISRFWRTRAHPPGSGPDYVNAAMSIRTSLSPRQVLDELHEIECNFGRDRSKGRWSSRVLDLDLIAFDDLIAPDEGFLRSWIDLPRARQMTQTPDRLILPHPRLQDRGFVLGPMAEIAPLWSHPLTGKRTIDMLAELGPEGLAGMSPLLPCDKAG